MRFPAFFDTNVLYGALLNDFILELADRGLFRPLWSEDVMVELSRNLIRNGEDPELVEKRITTMRHYFPDAMVTGHDDPVSTMTNDAKDRHVLAAAVALLIPLPTLRAPDLSWRWGCGFPERATGEVQMHPTRLTRPLTSSVAGEVPTLARQLSAFTTSRTPRRR